MNGPPALRALLASTASLLVALAAVSMFLPPLAAQTAASPARTVLAALALAVALLLHWVWLALAAHRGGRPAVGWLALSVLLFPFGSAAALIVLGCLGDDGESGRMACP